MTFMSIAQEPEVCPQRDLKIRSPRTIMGNSIRIIIGVIMGLYRGSNF